MSRENCALGEMLLRKQDSEIGGAQDIMLMLKEYKANLITLRSFYLHDILEMHVVHNQALLSARGERVFPLFYRC